MSQQGKLLQVPTTNFKLQLNEYNHIDHNKHKRGSKDKLKVKVIFPKVDLKHIQQPISFIEQPECNHMSFLEDCA